MCIFLGLSRINGKNDWDYNESAGSLKKMICRMLVRGEGGGGADVTKLQ